VINHRSAKTLCDILGQQVAMVAEKFSLDTLPTIPGLEERMRGLVLGGKDKSYIKPIASPGSRFDP
jgi:hypothetical protein